jgi:hypothetical protein
MEWGMPTEEDSGEGVTTTPSRQNTSASGRTECSNNSGIRGRLRPFGARGIGEPGVTAAPPFVMPFMMQSESEFDLPLTPEKSSGQLKERRKSLKPLEILFGF